MMMVIAFVFKIIIINYEIFVPKPPLCRVLFQCNSSDPRKNAIPMQYANIKNNTDNERKCTVLYHAQLPLLAPVPQLPPIPVPGEPVLTIFFSWRAHSRMYFLSAVHLAHPPSSSN
jgi:hypothetical protein